MPSTKHQLLLNNNADVTAQRKTSITDIEMFDLTAGLKKSDWSDEMLVEHRVTSIACGLSRGLKRNRGTIRSHSYLLSHLNDQNTKRLLARSKCWT